MSMEIERKFLVAQVPDIEAADRAEIEQGYLALGDGEGQAEVRLRRKGDQRLLTVKGGSGGRGPRRSSSSIVSGSSRFGRSPRACGWRRPDT